MNESVQPVVIWAALGGALVLFCVHLVMSALLTAVSALGQVSLHRINAESGNRLQFLQEMDAPGSPYRLSAAVARQFALLGGSVLVGVGAHLTGWSRPWLVGLAAGAVLCVLLLEMGLAQLIAMRSPVRVVRATAFLLRPLRILLSPVLFPLLLLVDRVAEEVRNGENGADEAGEGDAEALIRAAEEEGILEEDEGRMMRGIVDLGEMRIREVMTPRPDIVAMPADTPVRDAIQIVRKVGHSRFPIFRKSIDDVVGILHVRDLFQACDEGREDTPVSAFLRPPFFVPETRWVAELLAEMRTRTNMALVVDEYGGIEGLVTMEDLLEEIVGDIRDEHDDDDEALIATEPDGSWLVSGLAPVKELETLCDLKIPEKRDYDTVGGLVVATLGRLPKVGDGITIDDLRFEVIRADPRRVYRVHIRRLPMAETPEVESGA